MSSAAYTISITTKNRQAILADTVRQLARTAADAAELLLVDDGSAPPVDAASFGPLPFPVRLIRHNVSQGLIPSRNEIVRECRTPFVLSCDDDSYPISGSIREGVEFLAARPELFAVSFPYLEGAARKPMNPSRQTEPYPVRLFVACAYLFRTAYFLELGGFVPWFGRQNEERDLSYRVLMRGWTILHYPAITVFHHCTPVARNWEVQDFNTTRNEMVLELRRIPLLAAWCKIVRNGVLALYWTIRQCRWVHFRGYCAGLFARSSLPPGRLSWTEYRKFLSRPWA